MAGEEERRSFIILREDGLAIRTKPVTEDEAWWLYTLAYKGVRDRGARIRYLEEWGNVLDVEDYVERLKQLEPHLYLNVLGGFESPEEFEEAARWLLEIARDSGPELRQVLEGLANEARELYRRPVEPRPVEAPVRYLEASHSRLDGYGGQTAPEPEWRRARMGSRYLYGINIYRETFWLWRQNGIPIVSGTQAVIVRRDVDDKEVVAALANDGAVQGFLRWNADSFRHLIRENEVEMVSRGYADVVRKAKIVLTTVELLTAGRGEEEALPA